MSLGFDPQYRYYVTPNHEVIIVFLTPNRLTPNRIWPGRLTARIPPFQGEDRSSILRQAIHGFPIQGEYRSKGIIHGSCP